MSYGSLLNYVQTNLDVPSSDFNTKMSNYFVVWDDRHI